MAKIEYNESKTLKHSNLEKLEYIGKCLLVKAEGKKILVVGDLHLGYEEVLNRTGVFVTREMFKEMINYFDRIFDKAGEVNYVVLLGDVKHAFGEILRQEWNDVFGLFDYLEDKLSRDGEIIITKGNHDTILEPIVRKRKDVQMCEHFVIGKYCFVHGDMEYGGMLDKKIKCWIMGHGHPAIKLGDKVRIEKYKCFLVGKYNKKDIIIVPSFFDYIEGSDPRENNLKMAWDFDYDKFDVKIINVKSDELGVLDFGILGKLG